MVQVQAASDHPLFAGNVTPQQAWEALGAAPDARLIDVRTRPEWLFSGVPELGALGKEAVTISWKLYPNFELNPQFITQLEQAVPDKTAPLYFLCKTGGRSADAAIAATQAGYHACYNIAEGFEGDMNPHRQRGRISGWKAANLPWFQA